MGLLTRVRRTLERRGMLQRGRRWVVACSGGPDSTALLQALSELAPAFGLELIAASVDHGLRSEARAELALVARHAAELGLSHHLLEVSVETGRGRQAGARRARYTALQALATELGAGAIAVGHTRDDQAETLLGRLLRAPSVAGMAGIQPVRADGVIRPLLDCTRGQVLAFVHARELSFASDPSNGDPAFTRARIRHGLLPELLAENPRLVDFLAALAEDARQHQELVERSTPVLDLAENGARPRFLEQPITVRRWMLRKWLRERTGSDPKSIQIDALEAAVVGREVLVCGQVAARWVGQGALKVGPKTQRSRGSQRP